VRRIVLAVSASPALDRIVVAPGSAAGGTVRTSEVLDTPGGKAIHVAIVAGTLGATAEVAVPLGGRRGAHVRRLLVDEPLTLHAVAAEGETRRTTTIVDPEAGDVLEILEPAPRLLPAEVDALVELTARRARDALVVVVTGSAPPGHDELPLRLAHAARNGGASVVLDTSGPALAAGLAAADIVSPNLAEACALLGTPEPSDPGPRTLAALARALQARGAATVWLSAGRRGSLLATVAGAVHLAAPEAVRRVNAVGCGDALLGGLAAGIAEGLPAEEAAALGVAAATVKLGALHPARVDADATRALHLRIATTPIDAAREVAAR